MHLQSCFTIQIRPNFSHLSSLPGMSVLHVQDSRSQQLIKMVPLHFVGQTDLVQVVTVVQLLLWVVEAVSYSHRLYF